LIQSKKFLKMTNKTKVLYSILGVLSVLILWSGVVMFKLVNPILLPSPKRVIQELMSLVRTNEFWLDFGNTIMTWFLGLVIGILFGVVVGVLLALNEKIWFIFEPIIEFFRTLPSIILVPLISLFMGVGLDSKVLSVSVVVAVTIISTVGIAIRSINTNYKKLKSAWKLTTYETIKNIYLPEISSHLLIAIKASIPLALIVAIAADMLIATDNGLGKIITDSMAVFNATRMYAAILIVGVLGYLAAKLSELVENKFIHWKGK